MLVQKHTCRRSLVPEESHRAEFADENKLFQIPPIVRGHSSYQPSRHPGGRRDPLACLGSW